MTLLNGNIKAQKVQLINQNGENVGVVTKTEAFIQATELGLDLVQINDNEIPVCKLIDYNKFQYEKKKKSRENKESNVKWKEVQMGVNIGEHDLKTKVNSTKKFLNKGNKVKVFVILKGREMSYPKLGEDLLNKFKSYIGDEVKVTKDIQLEGNRLVMHLE